MLRKLTCATDNPFVDEDRRAVERALSDLPDARAAASLVRDLARRGERDRAHALLVELARRGDADARCSLAAWRPYPASGYGTHRTERAPLAVAPAGTRAQLASGHRSCSVLAVTDERIFLTLDGELVALDSATLAVAWRAPSCGTPFVHHGDHVLCARDEALVVLDGRTGRPRATWRHEGRISSVDAELGRALIAEPRGRVACIDIDTGTTAWSREREETVLAVGAAGGRVVLFGMDSLEVWRAEDGADEGVWRSDASMLSGGAAAGDEHGLVDAVFGDECALTAVSFAGETIWTRIVAVPLAIAACEDAVALVERRGAVYEREIAFRVSVRRRSDGGDLWSTERRLPRESAVRVALAPGTLYLGVGTRERISFTAFGLGTGEPLWRSGFDLPVAASRTASSPGSVPSLLFDFAPADRSLIVVVGSERGTIGDRGRIEVARLHAPR